MKAKLVREYIELPGKTKEQILSDMKYASKEQLNQALINACKEGQLDRVELLLAGGADVNAKDFYGNTILMSASTYGYKDIVSLLLDNGANINYKSMWSGWTALMKASYNSHKDIVKLLLDKGADVNIKSNINNTAIIYAFDKGIVKLLRKYGAKE